jgi:hypothetical protein
MESGLCSVDSAILTNSVAAFRSASLVPRITRKFRFLARAIRVWFLVSESATTIPQFEHLLRQ